MDRSGSPPNHSSEARPARIVTLGCRLNQADSALLTDRLEKAGFYVQSDSDAAAPELVIVNSCAVTAAAAAKSRQAARKLQALYPAARLVFTGCAAELGREAAGENPNWLRVSNVEKRELIGKLRDFSTAQVPVRSREAAPSNFHENAFGQFPYRTRAFIKIQEGCDNFCTYCIVPYTRGASRSRDFNEVVSDCRQAVGRGCPEIVITGVNTCNYADSGYDLESLIDVLCAEIPGEWRLRLSSTEPAPGNLRLLETMAKHADRVCRFLHLALQHGSDRVLKLMNRHYTTRDYESFVNTARELIPDIHLGTDVIAGFPGESDTDFQTGYDFIEKLGFANLHVFSYSKRAGTPAATMSGQIPDGLKKARHRQLEALGARMKDDFVRSQRGRVLPVIFETVDAVGMAHGWSDNYIAVSRPETAVPLARIVPVEL